MDLAKIRNESYPLYDSHHVKLTEFENSGFRHCGRDQGRVKVGLVV